MSAPRKYQDGDRVMARFRCDEAYAIVRAFRGAQDYLLDLLPRGSTRVVRGIVVRTEHIRTADSDWPSSVDLAFHG